MSRLEKAKNAFEVVKIAIDIWAAIVDRRNTKRDERIKALEAEIEALKAKGV